jgi:hypothetical protein
MVLSPLLRGLAFISFVCPLVFRDDLLTCVTQMDSNLDDTITEAEIDSFYASHSECLSSSFLNAVTGAQTITQCDMDGSGNLTLTDWNDPNGCFQQRSRQMVLCQACNKCGLLNIILKKKEEEKKNLLKKLH